MRRKRKKGNKLLPIFQHVSDIAGSKAQSFSGYYAVLGCNYSVLEGKKHISQSQLRKGDGELLRTL